MEKTFEWMSWIEIEERKLIWKRAAKIGWKTIAWELRCDRTTAWRKWQVACNKIAARLNAKKSSSKIFGIKPRISEQKQDSKNFINPIIRKFKQIFSR
jgi:hypothetical protein